MAAALSIAMASTLAFTPLGGNRAGGAQGEDLTGDMAPERAIWLDSLDLSPITQEYGSPHAGRSVDDNPITLGGVVYRHGVGTHANGAWDIKLNGAATRLVSMVGLDDERKGQGSITFEVWVDKHRVASTPVLHGGDPAQRIDVDLRGAKYLELRVGDAGDGNANDHADWAGALLYLDPNAKTRPQSGLVSAPAPARLTIPPADPRPAIHGPRIVGATPGYDFIFRIPATGKGPLKFSALGLPKSLKLDPATGVIRGAAPAQGVRRVRLMVRGPKGVAHRTLTIVTGSHKLALTPPLGWNSWNVWAAAITQKRTQDAADAMIKCGLAAHGFQYVNIDDTWELGTNGGGRKSDDGRNSNGEVLTNNKFPNMKALCDYIHKLGLKVGIYSSPGPWTCGQYTASYKHEDQDAATYAKWGMDYLKYDWCSYGDVAAQDEPDPLKRYRKPYRVMRASLDKVKRDIVFSFCQYGMAAVWRWGAQTGGNCWRTNGDINDSWGSLKSIFEAENGHEKYAGPGHWNDPDMLVVGRVGWGVPHPSHLKPNEQILHISMWCLFSSPLLIGCDMTRLDPFTLAILTNDEALDINQDPLGKPAGLKARDGFGEVWSRPLFDGTTAVGLVNTGPEIETVKADWKAIGVTGRQPVRDLWLHKNVGVYAGSYSVAVPPHGCVLLKIGRPKPVD
jgi:alpha-galactosidase